MKLETHLDQLIEERDKAVAEREFWKAKAARHAGYAKAVILAFHRFEDEAREALDSLGQS